MFLTDKNVRLSDYTILNKKIPLLMQIKKLREFGNVLFFKENINFLILR